MRSSTRLNKLTISILLLAITGVIIGCQESAGESSEESISTVSTAEVVISSTPEPTPTASLQSTQVPATETKPSVSTATATETLEAITIEPTPTVIKPTRIIAPTVAPLPDIDEDASQYPWLNFSNEVTESDHLSSVVLPGIGTPFPATQKTISTENIDQLTELAVWGKGVIEHATYSPDGSLIYATTARGLYVYDAETAEQINFRPIFPSIWAIAYLPSKNQLALSLTTQPPTVEIIDPQTLETINVLPISGPSAPIRLQASTDNALLIAWFEYDQKSEGRWVEGWQTDQWKSIISEQINPLVDEDHIPLVGFAADTKQLFFLRGLNLQTLDFKNSRFILSREIEILPNYEFGESRRSVKLSFFEASPNGKHLAASTFWFTGGDNIYLFDATTGKLNFETEEITSIQTNLQKEKGAGASKISTSHSSLSGPGIFTINQIEFSGSSTKFFTAKNSLQIEVWDIATKSKIFSLEDVGNLAALSPDEETLATLNHHISQWDIENQSYKNVTKQHIGEITDLEFIPNSKNLAISAADGFVYLRDLRSGGLLSSLRGYNENSAYWSRPAVTDIDITADGKTMAVAATDTVKLWNLATFEILDLKPYMAGGLVYDNQISISMDGSFVALAEHNAQVSIWQVTPDETTIPDFICFNSPHNPAKLLEIPVPISCGRICSGYPMGIAFSPSSPFEFICNSREEFGSTVWSNLQDKQTFLPRTVVEKAKYSRNGVLLAIIGSSTLGNGDSVDTLSVWETGDNTYVPEFILPIGWNKYVPQSLALSPNNGFIVISHPEQGVLFFKGENGEYLYHLPHIYNPTSVAISEDERYLAVGTEAGTVHLWAVP